MKLKVQRTIEKYNMIPHGAKVIVALSGGSDSMSLLHVLYSLKDDYGIEIEAAHVNHCLRGEEADGDENFVCRHCEEKGIKLHVLRADVRKIASEKGLSLEEAGRRVRYDFFSSLGDDVLIATAHNRDDRIETFLFNFTRGSSLRGLGSIPPVRGNIIRPLIDCTKEEINAFCRETGIPFVTDRTNADVHYSRNRIRHNVIPEMMTINPGFEDCAARCIDDINEDEKFLCSLALDGVEKARRAGGFDVETLASLSSPVLKRASGIIADELFTADTDSRMISDIVSAVLDYSEKGIGRLVQLDGNSVLRTRAGLLEIPADKEETPGEIILSTGKNNFGSFEITLEKQEKYTDYSQNIPRASANYCFDYDKIRGSIKIRARLPGDRLCSPSRGITKPLRKIQNEKGVPPEIREISPVIADDEGILGAYGCGVDRRAAVTADTVSVIRITITDGKENRNE